MKKYIAKMWGGSLVIVALTIVISNVTFIGKPNGQAIHEVDPSLQWEFFEQQLLSPKEASAQYGSGQKIQLPYSFKEHYGTAAMYGTFVAKVKLPKVQDGQNLAVYLPYQYGSYQLYVGEKLVAKNGVVATTKDQQVPETAPKIGQIHYADEEVFITMQLSNFYSVRGGFMKVPYIGEFSGLVNTHNTSIIFQFFITGIVFIASIFALLYGWFNNRNQQLILFALFSFTLAIRTMFARPFIYSITIFDVPWSIAVKIEMICSLLVILIAMKCLQSFYVEVVNQKFIRLVKLMIIGQIVLVLFTEPFLFQRTFSYIFLLPVVVLLYVYIIGLRKLETVNRMIIVNYVGTLVIFMMAIHDYIVTEQILERPTLLLYSLVVYVIMVSILISSHFAQKQKSEQQLKHELMELNASLDLKIQERTRQLEQANEALAKLATIDALTGIGNRYVFDKQLQQAFDGASAQEGHLSLLLIDIDEFKKFNDHYGHTAGDSLIQGIVETIQRQLPKDVLFARYGGEEFAIIYPHADEIAATLLGQQIVAAVANKRFHHEKHPLGYATISVGGYSLTPNNHCATPKQLIELADERLYKAKNSGKNCFKNKI